jgi:hypothetical protein
MCSVRHNHDQLVRQALDGAREHAKAARDIYLNYLRAGTELDTMIEKERARKATEVSHEAQTGVDAAEQALAASKTQRAADVEAVNQAIAMAQVGGNAGISWAAPPQSTSVKNARAAVEHEVHSGGGKQTNVNEDRLRIALAQLAVAAANAEAAEKADIVAIRQHAYDTLKSVDNEKLLTEAKNQEAQAALDVTKANNALVVAQQKMTFDIAQQWNTLMNGLIQKVGAPGLGGAGSATAPLTFNPMEMLFAAFEQTRSFADIMTTVTQIMQTFAQAMDALKPMIDALLDVVRAVVNVFIFLYNGVARILDLFGMQIQQLQYLNSAIGALVPLIEIWHEIPTLNELAAGKLNSPLSTTPTGTQNVGGSGQGQNMLMKIVEILTGVLIATIVMKVFEGMSLQSAVQSTLHLIGINLGVNKISPTAVALSAQEKSTAIGLAGKSDALANIIGAKTAGLTATTNALLLQILSTLQSMLASLQTQSTGGLGAIIGLATKSGIAGAAVLPGGAGGPLAPVQQAIKAFGDGLRNIAQSIRSTGYAFDDFTARVNRCGNAIDAMAARANAFGGPSHIGSISTALSLDMSRRIAVTGYGIDRVPT